MELMPQTHEEGVWQTISDKRIWMQEHMMDCFMSPEMVKRMLI